MRRLLLFAPVALFAGLVTVLGWLMLGAEDGAEDLIGGIGGHWALAGLTGWDGDERVWVRGSRADLGRMPMPSDAPTFAGRTPGRM